MGKNSLCLVFFYQRINRYSINALLGALSSRELLEEIDIFLCDSEKSLFETIAKEQPNYQLVVVGFSFFTPQLPLIYSLVSKIRRNFPSVILLAGGPHPSGAPRQSLDMGFDVVVRGEGEEVLCEILRAIFQGKNTLKEVKSIYFKEKEKIFFTGRRPWVHLDDYSPFCESLRRFGPLEITRGCPFGCFFCQTSYMFGKEVRHRSIDTIVSYVELYVRRGMRDIRFITPNAFSYGSPDGIELNLSAIEELLKEVKRVIGYRGRIFFGSFPSEVRPEHVTKETLSLVKRYANNDNLVIGCQSGSDRILNRCHRQHTVEDVYRAVRLCVEMGFVPKVDFIFGLPGEERTDIEESVKVMRDLIEMGAKIHAHTFMPLPGTPFFKKSPGRLSLEIKNFIKKILPFGKIFGEWEKQEKISKEVWEILKKREITHE